MIRTKVERPPPPSWIDKSFVEAVLNSSDDGPRLNVEASAVDYANKEGSGFLSYVFRIVASTRGEDGEAPEEKRLILKCEVLEERIKEVREENQLFLRESLVLREMLPRVHTVLQALEASQFRPLTARFYQSGQQPLAFLVLEDLTASGFRMAEAGVPLDLDHCRVVVQAYARLHAGSARFLRDNPEYQRMELLDTRTKPSESHMKFFEQMADRLFRAVAKEFRTIDGYQGYADKYERLARRVAVETTKYWMTQEATLPVILHGDCWKNNFMFKYDGGKAVETRLLDFQYTKVHNPACDLLYFLYTNGSEDLHRHHLDHLLEEYHGALTHLLRHLDMAEQADAYPLERLRKDMDDVGLLAVFCSAMTPVAQLSEKYSTDVASLLQTSDASMGVGALQEAYRIPHILSFLKYLAPVFDSKGLLDTN